MAEAMPWSVWHRSIIGHIRRPNLLRLDGDVGVSDAGPPVKQVSATDYREAYEGNGVRCFTPQEVATVGEAFTVADIAGQESWETLSVATHRDRAF